MRPLLDDTTACAADADARETTDPRRVIALAAAGNRRVHEQYRDILYGLVRQAPGEPAAQQVIDDAGQPRSDTGSCESPEPGLRWA
jgi:hypothetical protein